MNNNIVLSLFSRPSPKGELSAKNYPWPEKLVELLRGAGYKTTQIKTLQEPDIGADEKRINLFLKEIEKLCIDSFTWISVDNFLPHLMNHTEKSGVVLFGKSNPKHFGYSQNQNLYKSEFYFRVNQFGTWFGEPWIKEGFVTPEDILKKMTVN